MQAAAQVPRRHRRDLARAEVVECARSLIAREGLEAVSLRRVGATLGVSAPALYTHVDDKQDLLRAVAEAEFTRLIAAFEAVAEADPIDAIRARARAYVDHARARPELFRVMLQFQPAFALGAGGTSLPEATRAFEVGVGGVRDAMDAGSIRRADPLLTGLTIWTAVHGVASVLLSAARIDRDHADRLFDSVIETLLDGLRTGGAKS